MSMKEWMELDIDSLELEEVTELEKKRVKQHVLNKRKKTNVWRNMAVASVMLIGVSTAASFAYPSFATQLPFMDDVIRYFSDEPYKEFEDYSTDIGLTETSNGVTILIDNAVYDGTNIKISYAIETDKDFGEDIHSGGNWFDIKGANGSGGSDQLTKISPTRYVGLSTITPSFKGGDFPEKVEITWEPQTLYSTSNDTEVKGDWSFAFSLKRLEGDLQLINETVQSKDVTFTLKSVEFTDVSTVIAYKQVTTDDLLEEWPEVSPVFKVTDDLGHVYMDGTGGGGFSTDNGKTYEGTTEFGTIQDGASRLIIEPIEIASLGSGKGHTEIELEPIIIDLKE
ncbi:DUF4179 domain-containing protein [Rossellomorea sp. SC111]|uniref:DUF4179 domain-containing protein n=1 Tax=Rossellomorea sp. SC111 TaxID=2968985 RepID=UPI00215AA040|nr:DUF4179 domain-containing protein [Rossellomorea sp. SC111]MCR8851049.1 DUF4179 domain-containing protein [Rossellomorea sp. SC111]